MEQFVYVIKNVLAVVLNIIIINIVFLDSLGARNASDLSVTHFL